MRNLVLLIVLAGCGVAFASWTVARGHRLPPEAQPVVPPATSSFRATVAGAGLLEPASEAIAIGSPVNELITEVPVAPGGVVAAGAVLLRLDDRMAKAQEVVQQAALAVAESSVVVATSEVATARDRVQRASGDFVSAEERSNRSFALASAEARLAQAKAGVDQAKALLTSAHTEVDRRVVRAPVAGTVLRVNARAGEFAPVGRFDPPLLTLGNLDELRLRVDIDENDAWRVQPDAKAEGAVRGNPALRLPLRFVRIEPYVVPKKSLTGLSSERVDTRVLQVIFAVERGDVSLYAGQQMDVFIETKAQTLPMASTSRSAASPPTPPVNTPPPN